MVTIQGSGFNPRKLYRCMFIGTGVDSVGVPFPSLLSNATLPKKVSKVVCVVPACNCNMTFTASLVVTGDNITDIVTGPTNYQFLIGQVPDTPAPVIPLVDGPGSFPLVAAVLGGIAGALATIGLVVLLVVQSRKQNRVAGEIAMGLLDNESIFGGGPPGGSSLRSDGGLSRKKSIFGLFRMQSTRRMRVETRKGGDLIVFAPSDITVHERIGYGSSGMVYRASWQVYFCVYIRAFACCLMCVCVCSARE